MSQHPNAKLTPKGRETLVSRIGSGLGVAEAARQMGVSRQTASKWLARARRGEGLADRSSRPRRLARLTPPRGRGARLRGPQGHAAGAARPGGRDGRAGPHVRPDRRQAQPAPPGRHRPRHGRGAAARPRDGRALRARAPRGARPRRRQEGGAHTRRRRPQGPRARLRLPGRGRALVPTRGGRRQQPRRLRRAAARREEGHGLRLHVPGARVLRGAGRLRGAGHDRQRAGLPLRGLQRAAGGPGRQAQVHPPLQPPAERQGGAHEPHAGAGVAVRPRMGERRGRGPPPSPPSWSTTIGTVRTARAGACPRCHASSA